MKKRLITTYDGVQYDILLDFSGFSKTNKVTINGVVFPKVEKNRATVICVTYPIKLGEKDAELILNDGKLSVAVDGITTDGKPVDRGVKPPWWIYIFVVLCVILVFTGGAISAGIGAGAGMYSYLFACKKDKSTATKFFLASGLTLAAWLLWLVVTIL